VEDLGGLLAAFALLFLFLGLCGALGFAATAGSFAILIGPGASRRLSLRKIMVLTVAVALVFMVYWRAVLYLGFDRPWSLVIVGSLLFPLVALPWSLYHVLRRRPWWQGATALAVVGLAFLAVPAGFVAQGFVSFRSDQEKSKKEQAELLRAFPSDAIYVPDTDAMPPGTDEGPYFSAKPEGSKPQTYLSFDVSYDSRDYNPAQVSSIDLTQRPDARNYLKNCDSKVTLNCGVVETTLKGRKIRSRYSSGAEGYYFVVIGESGIEIDIATLSGHGKPKDFDLVRFVDSLEPIPKDEFLKNPPRGTYFSTA